MLFHTQANIKHPCNNIRHQKHFSKAIQILGDLPRDFLSISSNQYLEMVEQKRCKHFLNKTPSMLYDYTNVMYLVWF